MRESASKLPDERSEKPSCETFMSSTGSGRSPKLIAATAARGRRRLGSLRYSAKEVTGMGCPSRCAARLARRRDFRADRRLHRCFLVFFDGSGMGCEGSENESENESRRAGEGWASEREEVTSGVESRRVESGGVEVNLLTCVAPPHITGLKLWWRSCRARRRPSAASWPARAPRRTWVSYWHGGCLGGRGKRRARRFVFV